jgi:hypothetical protein
MANQKEKRKPSNFNLSPEKKWLRAMDNLHSLAAFFITD